MSTGQNESKWDNGSLCVVAEMMDIKAYRFQMKNVLGFHLEMNSNGLRSWTTLLIIS